MSVTERNREEFENTKQSAPNWVRAVTLSSKPTALLVKSDLQKTKVSDRPTQSFSPIENVCSSRSVAEEEL